MSEKIIVAAVQMVSTPEPAENMRTVTRLVREAADAGASLVLLPEYLRAFADYRMLVFGAVMVELSAATGASFRPVTVMVSVVLTD